MSIPSDNQKNVEKSHVPMKSANPGRFAPSRPNNNLVISFSDDDSGSDFDDDRRNKVLGSKSLMTRVDGKRRPLTSSAAKLNLGHNAKVMPKKSSINHTFISSMTKIHGGINSKGAGPSSAEQGSRIRNFSTVSKNLATPATPERGSDQVVSLNQSKLQDLRQQIALRESELKLKAAQQNIESVSLSCRDDNVMNTGNDAGMKFKSLAAIVGQREPKEPPKEPDRKCLKVGRSYSGQLTSDDQKVNTQGKHILTLKEPVLENSNLQLRDNDCGPKTIPTSKTKLSIVKWKKQNDRPVDASPEVLKDGAGINASYNQSERTSRGLDPCNQSDPVASNMPMSSVSMDLNRLSKVGGQHTLSSFLKEAAGEQDLMNRNQCSKLFPDDRTLGPHLNKKRKVSLDNASCWNCAGNVNVSGQSDMDVEALIEMEESLDKELEEAQEHRRMCEIEERNALKAYRKAQRALIEANARCTSLYRRRELCSARYRSLIMNDSCLLWPCGQHEHVGTGLNSLNNMTENMELIPVSSHQMQYDYADINEQRDDSNLQHVNAAHISSLYQHENGRNVRLEQCSEPDASTSEALPHVAKSTAHGVSSPSNDPNVSADDDEETFPMDDGSTLPSLKYQQKEPNSKGKQSDPHNESNKKFSADVSQDPLHLEATLRSELFARLRRRPLSKPSNSCDNAEPAVEPGAEYDSGSDKTQISNGSVPFNEVEKDQEYNLGGVDRAERSLSESSVQTQNQCDVEKSSLKVHSPTDFEDGEFLARAHHPMSSIIISPPLILRSTFSHMKVDSPIISLGLQAGNQRNQASEICGSWDAFVNRDVMWLSGLTANSMRATLGGSFGGEMGSYTSNCALDPFWPLCMYELRGKCNNDECPWQHLKCSSNGNLSQHKQDDYDRRVGLALHQKNCCPPPTYLVAMNILKADQHSFESLTARKSERRWQKCFSNALALSCLFQRDLTADEPLQSSDGRIEIHGSWSRESSYLRSRNGIVNQLKQAVVNDVQSLEMALLILNQEVNKVDGTKKALMVLSHALEADPISETLWIVYLLIYYSSANSIGKDDMFSFAVKHNESSYVLWLLYINSRTQLDDWLAAYDAALAALCCHFHSNKDTMHASACILDLFLQMINFLCMSGNVEKAIQRTFELFPAATRSDDCSSQLLANILTCLTISDKCAFWVCCVYLVIYRKLPDAVVKQFEYEKELLSIEWPSIQLGCDQKKRALELVEVGIGSIGSYIDCESHKSVPLKSVQHFALCHIRCVVALDGFESGMTLLGKYVKLLPSCLELILLSARVQKHVSKDSSFARFEEAARDWPKELPGIHCIWNQYAEYALQNERPDFGKEVIFRWFNSVWKVKYPQNEISDGVDADLSCGSLESASASIIDYSVYPNQLDIMFGFLNLSLYNLLHNNHLEAQLAIERALKAAAPENFKHCVREHAMFLLTNESQSKCVASLGMQLEILNGYLNDARGFPVSKPLSRQFMAGIEKPRVHQQISNLLCPASSDSSVVNLVLDAWYGPSLLPRNLNNPKNLVDFVEAVLDVVPSNYQLTFSVCKMVSSDNNSGEFMSPNVLFWASSTLVNAIFCAVPVAPEYAWVEAADILGNIKDIDTVSERFYKAALSAYPFSLKLWTCYHNICKKIGGAGTVVEAARKKGIEID